MDLRRLIRARRALLGMTQKALAEQVGVHYNLICRFERGKGNLSFSVLSQLCAVLGLRLTVEVVREEAVRDAV